MTHQDESDFYKGLAEAYRDMYYAANKRRDAYFHALIRVIDAIPTGADTDLGLMRRTAIIALSQASE